MIYLDTHVIVWLYLGDMFRISTNARKLINENDLKISPMVCLELQYLKEIGRLKTDVITITDYLEKSIDLQICNTPFQKIITEAIKLTWTRDPFDRLIVSHSIAGKCTLITKDENIRNNYNNAIW